MSIAESNSHSIIQDLYDQGAYVRAYETALAAGLFDDDGPDALVLRSRLTANLGAPRKSTALGLRALRAFPNHARVRYFGVRSLLSTRGPWEARQAWLEFESSARPSDPMRADWIAMKGMLAGILRDFETADQALDEAQRLEPDSPWLFVERSEILTYEDRHDEALEAARQALVCRPDYRPAVQNLALRLENRNRADEAIELLSDVAERLESGAVFYQLAGLLCDARRFDEAHAALERIPPLWPLTEKSHAQGLAAFHSRCAYHRGDEPAAIEFAKQAKTKYYDAVAERLSQATDAEKRVLLEVPFVRQNYSTCGPATLSAVSGYWGRQADHLEVAEKICYDGTTTQSERQWAEQAGYHVREFSVDLPTAQSLIDRGVPFTLATVDVTSSHLQAVVGYDARLGVLLVRDSNFRTYAELIAEKGLEYYRPTGPRGMVMVPQEELARLDGLALPDAELYDGFHQLCCALDKFDRPAAAAAHERMRQRDPNHRLTLQGRRALASFDGDPASGRTACEQLVKQFPEADVYLYPLWFMLRRLAPLAERLEFLEGVLKRHDCDPAFRLHKAEELCDDARTHVEAERLLRRIIRYRGFEPRAYHLLGNLCWTERRFDEARDLFFAAACLAAKDEDYAKSYFTAARRVKEVDRALEFLRGRFRRYGSKSPYPARTLFACLNLLDLMDEAFAVLDEALKLRPDDGSLLLFAADAHARSGRFELAEEFRKRSEGKAHPGEFLYRSADIASMRGDFTAALDTWRKLQEQEPQSVDAAAAVARLIADADGRDAAYRYIIELVERFPHNIELLQLAAEMLRDDEPAEAERLVRRLLEHNPIDPWARRELALDLLGLKRYQEALAELDTAEALEPTSTTVFAIRGSVLETEARWPEARAAYRRALELSVDQTPAISALVRLATTHAERVEALEFVYKQLAGQTTYGDAILSYAQHAGNTLPAERVLENLQKALAARPDLWHAWSAVVRQLQAMSRFDEAHELARREAERFSVVPGSWLDLASVCRARGDDDAEIAALEHALEINPTWTEALRMVCQAHERRGDFEQARTFALQAVRRAPSDAVLLGYLADLHWRADEQSEALAALERAVALEPGYDWGWRRLGELGRAVGEPDRAANAARALAERAPLQARSWMIVAETLDGPETLDERLQAVDRALDLNPPLVTAHVLRSRLFIEKGDFEAAAAATRPECFDDALPAQLGLQRAEVLDAQGDRAAAIAEVERLVAEHPDFRSGWIKLVAWFEAGDQEGKKFLAAAEALVGIDSQEAYFQRQLAEARMRVTDESGAQEAYRRALELEPGYEYCANCLIDLALDKGDYEQADRWIAHTLERDPTPFALARHVRAECERERFDEAVSSLERLCRMDVNDNEWPVRSAVDNFCKPGGRSFAGRVLLEAMRDPEAISGVFTAWVDLCAADDEWEKCERVLDQHRDRREHWVCGVKRLLSLYGDRAVVERVRPFIDREAAALRPINDLWDEAGYALYCNGYDRAVERWLGDWRTRSDIQPKNTVNLGWSLTLMGKCDEAREVHEAALRLPVGLATDAHRLAVAYDEAVRGSWGRAATELEQVDVTGLAPDDAELHSLLVDHVDLRRRFPPETKPNRDALAIELRGLRARHPTQVERSPSARICRRIEILLDLRTAQDYGHWFEALRIRLTRLWPDRWKTRG